LKKFPRTRVQTVLKSRKPLELFDKPISPSGQGKTKWKDDEIYLEAYNRVQAWASLRNYGETVEVLLKRCENDGTIIDIYKIARECLKLVDSGNNAEVTMEKY